MDPTLPVVSDMSSTALPPLTCASWETAAGEQGHEASTTIPSLLPGIPALTGPKAWAGSSHALASHQAAAGTRHQGQVGWETGQTPLQAQGWLGAGMNTK